MNPTLNGQLSNQMVNKLSNNSLIFIDNLKNQKVINKFNQFVSFNNNFQYDCKKMLVDQIQVSMGYEENKESEALFSK